MLLASSGQSDAILAWIIHEDAPACGELLARRVYRQALVHGTVCRVGLLGCWRPISGHLRHACLTDRVIYRLRQSSRNCLGT